MSQSLPYENIEFSNNTTLEQVLKTPDDDEIGYILEVDLIYPVELRDKLKEYPPCPENVAAKKEWLSDFQTELAKKN